MKQLNRFWLPPQRGFIVRIREQEGGVILTVKGPSKGNTRQGIFSRFEFEQAIPPEWLICLLQGQLQQDLSAVLKNAGVSLPIKYVGQFINVRDTFLWQEMNIKIFLDHSIFPHNAERFEVELETDEPQPVLNKLGSLLDSLCVNWRPADASKFEFLLQSVALQSK